MFNYYFKYSNPSGTYRKLNEVDTENNIVKVNFIKVYFTDSKKDIENAPKYDVDKIEKMNKIVDIVETILFFNNEDQQGKGLKT